MRHSPSLTFIQDDVQETVKHIDDLIAAARESDEQVHRLAAGASYAGDAQPYRVLEDDEAEATDDADDIAVSERR